MALRILIADDDLDTLKLVGTTLEREGFDIVAASDGEKALALVAEDPPALILLDVMMPKIDGLEVTRRLKNDPQTAGIPIILFTAKAQVTDKVMGLELGADDYLTKPTHPAELVARVKALLKRPTGYLAGALPPLPDEDALPRQSIAILGSKGGQGVSTLAINLGMALHTQSEQVVVLAEMRPGRGDMGIYLGFEGGDGLNKLLQMEANVIRLQDVEQSIKKHKSGLRVLAASERPSDAALMAATEQAATVARILMGLSPYVVFDLGTGLPPLAQNLVKQCTRVLVVTEPYPVAVPRTLALLKDLDEQGVDPKMLMLISINRVRTDQNLSGNALEKALGRPLDAVFTPAPELAFQAARNKVPMAQTDPDSFTAQQSARLASSILEPVTEE